MLVQPNSTQPSTATSEAEALVRSRGKEFVQQLQTRVAEELPKLPFGRCVWMIGAGGFTCFGDCFCVFVFGWGESFASHPSGAVLGGREELLYSPFNACVST